LQPHPVEFPFTDFGGYDIAADPVSPVPHRALVSYSIKGPTPNFDIYVERYPGPWVTSAPPWSMPITATGGIEEATQPTICSDCVDIGGNQGGMFVAWDRKYVNNLWQTVHKVQANRVVFPGIPAWIFPHLDVSMDVTAKTWPDIASREDIAAGTEPRSMVAWEGGGESSPCSPPRPIEIYAQYLESSVTGGYRGLLWSQEKMVAPGAGNYTQTRPTVLSSDGDTYSCFWLDARAGTDNPMGTRMARMDARTIVWMKRSTDAQVSHFTVTLYPNPLHTSSGTSLELDVDNEREEYVRIRMIDLLGREVVTLHDGLLTTGRQHIEGQLPQSLAPGSYVVTMQSATRHTVLPLLILR
jgi:hypothetical protein